LAPDENSHGYPGPPQASPAVNPNIHYSPSSSINPPTSYQSNVQHQHTNNINYKFTLITMFSFTTSLLSPLIILILSRYHYQYHIHHHPNHIPLPLS
jgi:hypothetical protein